MLTYGDNSECVDSISPKNGWTIGEIQSVAGTILVLLG